MNGRQAAKLAAKRIEELEYFNRSAGATIKRLYQAIDMIIAGENICEVCEDFNECQLEAKKQGKGCHEWSHKYSAPEEVADEEITAFDGLTGGCDES